MITIQSFGDLQVTVGYEQDLFEKHEDKIS